ncbi:MAG: tetratricopeptide repeat protein [Gammaproteobacteria bacterium]|nr:tetratricopeptide repeat protein [Gammaproteobacteria bacterium]
MTVFVILAILMALAAIAVVAWPLLKSRAEKAGDQLPAPDRTSLAILAVLIPLLAGVLYANWSNWPWDPAAQISEASNPHGAAGDSGSLDEAAAKLVERLAAQPDDVEGWKMLGRTYVVSGNYGKAREAYEKALDLTKGADVDAVLGAAEARVLVNEAEFDGEAGAMFESAIAAEPGNPKALWYSGLVAYRKEQWQLARDRWGALAAVADVPENIKQLLSERIAELDTKLGKAPAPVAQAPAAPAATGPAGNGISARVEIAPALKPLAKPEAALFVLARPVAGGPPVAAVRKTAGELPFSISLTDKDVMTEGVKLTQFGELTLVARVSLSGRPQASSGDLFGELRYDFKNGKPVTLIIDRVVP